jgi:hypothetical protein
MDPVTRLRPYALRLAAAALLVAGPLGSSAYAAEDYANCTGYIDSLPATISAAGTWCLRGTRYTSQTSGAAITIAADNVTVDCNHFRISNLGADWRTTTAVGVYAGGGRKFATIRQCRLQGFNFGVKLAGDGHIVEGNTIDRSRYIGVLTDGDGVQIRDNAITDTGGPSGYAYGIYATAPATALAAPSIVDNTITRVADRSTGSVHQARGILTNGTADGNHVHLGGVAGDRIGVKLLSGGAARDNVFTGATPNPDQTRYDWLPARSIVGSGVSTSVCRGNTSVGFGNTEIADCQDGGGNRIETGGPRPEPPCFNYPWCE